MLDEKSLLEALQYEGLITKEIADRARREAPLFKKGVEDFLYSQRFVDERAVAEIKSKISEIPFRDSDPTSVDDELLKLIPPDTARQYRMVPLERDGNTILFGMVHPEDQSAQEALRFIAKKEQLNVGVYIVTPTFVESVLRRTAAFSDDIRKTLESINVKKGEGISDFSRIISLEEGMSARGAEEAPVIRIISLILKEGVNANASDIHIEPGRSKLRVRFRKDGQLEEYIAFPPELYQPMVARVKVLAGLKLDETRMPQDGRFRTRIFDREIDFRVATFPTPAGEKVALRVLDPTTGLKDLPDLGITGVSLALLKEATAKPFGMILLTGPTGSGKTTTLYALMQTMNNDSVNILSLEDPVEYTIDGVNQSQVKPEIGYDFASGLRQILRQDPDVIMVGEIRDSETASLAVHAALTGHIVLSTLHTNNAIGVIPRLRDMGVEPYILPSALNLMAAQRLVGRLCEKCKTKQALSSELLAVVKKEIEALPESTRKSIKEPYESYSAKGCAACRRKGVTGRVALFEAFRMTPELSSLVTKNADEGKIYEEAKRQGTIFLRGDGIIKALQGLVSLEEVLRETEGV